MQSAATVEDADVHSATDEYAARFAGAAGQWLLSRQELLLKEIFSGDLGPVLDVGGGHGQGASVLARLGIPVTVLASDQSATEQLRHLPREAVCEVRVGPLNQIPYEAESFGTVLSLRLLAHAQDWRRLVAEFCRVAKERVVIDFASTRSVNAAVPILFNLKKRHEGNTRDYLVFNPRELADEFAKHGFTAGRMLPQFFLPMVLHRMLRCVPLSRALEAAAAVFGLTEIAGSPIIAEYLRR